MQSQRKRLVSKNQFQVHQDDRIKEYTQVKQEKPKRKQWHGRCINGHGHSHLFSFICSRNRHTMEQKKRNQALGMIRIDESVLGIRIECRFHASLHKV